MPQLQKLWEQYENKGLHIFHCESQGADKEKLEEWLGRRGVTFPNTIGGGDFSAYEGESGLPYAFVVGVDGTVVWQGRSGYKKVIHDEMKKVRYPGLGKTSVAKGLEKAAALFGAKQYAKAAKEARSKLDKAEGETPVAADAKYIISKTVSVRKKLQAAIERHKSEREYTKALTTLQLMARAFKGTPEGSAAKQTVKEMKKDAAVKKELKADAALARIRASFDTMHDITKKKSILDNFSKQFSGTRAAEHALQLKRWL